MRDFAGGANKILHFYENYIACKNKLLQEVKGDIAVPYRA